MSAYARHLRPATVILRTVLLATALSIGRPVTGLAQQLILSGEVGKNEFFEDEPIYVVVRLQNVGTDTAWVTYLGGSLHVTLSVSHGNGDPVPVGIPIIDWIALPPWRGDPVAPGADILTCLVLQDFAGDKRDSRRHLFISHLSPDQYVVQVEFDAHAGVPGAAPLLLKAAPISFRIREPSAAEEAEVAELEAMRRMLADTTLVDGHPRAVGYYAALLHWAERRWREHPDDPFLPFVLDNGLYLYVGKILEEQIISGKAPRFDPDTSELVSRLRLAVINRQKVSTGSARLVQSLAIHHSDQVMALATSLGSTPGGEMARYQVERNQQVQRSKRQPPR